MQNVWPTIRPTFFRWLPLLCAFLGIHLWIQVVSLTVEGSFTDRFEMILPWGLASMFFLVVGVAKHHSLSLFLIFPMTVVVPMVFASGEHLPAMGLLIHYLLFIAYLFLGLIYMRSKHLGIVSHRVTIKKPMFSQRHGTLPIEILILSFYTPLLFVVLMSLPLFYSPLSENLHVSFGDRSKEVTSLAYVIGTILFYGLHQALTTKTFYQYKKNFPAFSLRLMKNGKQKTRTYWRMMGLAFAIILVVTVFVFSRAS